MTPYLLSGTRIIVVNYAPEINAGPDSAIAEVIVSQIPKQGLLFGRTNKRHSLQCYVTGQSDVTHLRCPVRRTSSVAPPVMALLSVLTPVLALVLCLLIGYMLVTSRDAESTSRLPGQAAKVDSRPWVDQDLQDDTEHAQREDGKKKQKNNLFLPFHLYCLRLGCSVVAFKKRIKFHITYVF